MDFAGFPVMRLPENHPVAEKLGGLVLSALGKNALFIAAALPAVVAAVAGPQPASSR